MTEATPMDPAAALADGSPQAAASALAGLSARYNATPAAPAASATAARARLDQLSSSETWRQAFFSGNAESRREFAELVGTIAAANETAEALSPTPPPPQEFETTLGGELNTRNRAAVVADLRQSGLDDNVVRQVLDGHPVTAAERLMAERYKEMLLGSKEFMDAYMRGAWAERRTMTLCNTILCAEVTA
jgi:hypothetical protein